MSFPLPLYEYSSITLSSNGNISYSFLLYNPRTGSVNVLKTSELSFLNSQVVSFVGVTSQTELLRVTICLHTQDNTVIKNRIHPMKITVVTKILWSTMYLKDVYLKDFITEI